MKVNDRVRALANLDEYIEGQGVYRCAAKGEILVIRAESEFKPGRFSVSHPDRTDGMTFSVESHEVEPE